MIFWVQLLEPFFSRLEALQVPLGSLPEPLMLILGSSSAKKIWFSDCKITLFVNAAFWYFEALDVLFGVLLAHLGPFLPQNGPQN